MGFDAMMFHDDDAVPDIDNKSEQQIRKEAKELQEAAGRRWASQRRWSRRVCGSARRRSTALTRAMIRKHRQYAIDRSLRCIDIANILGTDLIVLVAGARRDLFARSEERQAQRGVVGGGVRQNVGARQKNAGLAIEPKPNEPMDHAYLPTIGHALAIAQLTRDPKRVGCLIETAHAILAGLDPADEIDFAMSVREIVVAASQRSERVEV